jgi:hypothetical protein
MKVVHQHDIAGRFDFLRVEDPAAVRRNRKTATEIIVGFVTPVHAEANIPDREQDGLLATVLFQRVYISHADHYVIFDPR